MTTIRIALANLPFPPTPDQSVTSAEHAIAEASAAGADVICFPECFVPGYRAAGKLVPPPDSAFLDRAWSAIGAAARKAALTVVLGTERVVDGAVLPSAVVIDRDGTIAGFQDKVQIDPSEETTYTSGSGRRVFEAGQVVFHPQFHEAEPGSYQPSTFADPANSFHEKAALCRAAENTCFFATVNYAGAGSPTTSAIVRPDGRLLCYQPYGKPGLLIGDIDTSEATGLLAARCKSCD